jgi:hypothetical protein
MKRASTLAAVVTLILAPTLIGAPLAAQPPDVVPRSVFLPASNADGDPVPGTVECYPAFCKYYPDDGAFSSTRIWTHTTNIGGQLLWLEVCTSDSDGDYLYGHFELRPGQTMWVTQSIPKGHWGWIQNWVVVPDVEPTDPEPVGPTKIELGHSSSALVDDPATPNLRINETVGTLQMARSPFGPPQTSSMRLAPGPDTPAWAVRTGYDGAAGFSTSLDGWQALASPPGGAAVDPRLDRAARSTVRRLPDGFVLTVEEDAGRDGAVDHVSRLKFQKGKNSKHLLLTTTDGGRQSFHRTVDKTHERGREIRRIAIDRDGDGVVDAREVEVAHSADGVTWAETRRDLDNDGTVDEVERMRLAFHGLRHSAQLTEIFDGVGNLKEKIAIRVNPTPGGYRIVTLHDGDGDAVYDSRELQVSQVGPFGQGTDIDTLKIDNDNDGVFETSHTSVTHKSLGQGTYRETVRSDLGSDGTVEAVTRRAASFAPREE